MALLSPSQIQNVLKETPLFKDKSVKSQDLQDILDACGVSREATIETIGRIMRGADTNATQLAAAKIALELNGLMRKDAIAAMPIVNIIINDHDGSSINPILIPRTINASFE